MLRRSATTSEGVLGVGEIVGCSACADTEGAVQDWQPQSKGRDAVLDPASATVRAGVPLSVLAVTLEVPALVGIVASSPQFIRGADARDSNSPSIGSYAEQPRHQTVTSPVRARMTRIGRGTRRLGTLRS